MSLQDKQAIVGSDTAAVMGLFSEGYQLHQYEEWLLTTVANVLDDQLSISSAGLLKDGAIAWVEVSMPETISSPEGFDFRPNLLATTRFDGPIATTYKRTITAVVSDNNLPTCSVLWRVGFDEVSAGVYAGDEDGGQIESPIPEGRGARVGGPGS